MVLPAWTAVGKGERRGLKANKVAKVSCSSVYSIQNREQKKYRRTRKVFNLSHVYASEDQAPEKVYLY